MILKLALMLVALATSAVSSAQEGSSTDSVIENAEPIVFTTEIQCTEAPCPKVEIIVANDRESNSAARKYVKEAIDEASTSEIIGVGVSDSVTSITQSAVNASGHSLSNEASLIIKVAPANPALPAVVEVKKLLSVNEETRAIAVVLPTDVGRSKGEPQEHYKERIVYTIIRAGSGHALNTTVGISVGIDPFLAVAFLGTLGSAYNGSMQYNSDAYYHWASHHGLKPSDQAERATLLEVIGKRTGVGFLYLATLSLLTDVLIGQLPVLSAAEISNIFLTAGNSVASTHYWFKVQDLMTGTSSLTNRQKKLIARVQFTIGIAGSVVMLMDLMDYQSTNYTLGALFVSGVGAYNVIRFWQSKDDDKGLPARMRAWWQRSYQGCAKAATYLNVVKFLKSL